ncbi:hypothetical protein Pan44_36260 [Caulifigura coniformis]|uniref:Helix-turn-helix domain-containing protein n=1 Tax=Caulifigura coniformis TaxID=2527983 RepID=A0A517SHI3_9PLAN|nr:helix-turn-helix domain-containing protein [Caulifigura coniformis]QDT55581.1 hypothetical protein Pan44_36260 [Caulifigura coniformis]
MIKNTKAAAGVVATSPFLTLEQAAAELRIEQINVLRLIARGRLLGIRAGDDWKVRPADLEEYVARGAQDLQAPGWGRDEDRPADPDGSSQAHAAGQIVRKAMKTLIPASLDSISKDGRGRYPAFLMLSGATIRPLLNQVYSPLVRFKDAEPSRYKTLKEALATAGLRSKAVSRIVNQSASESALNPQSIRERLFGDGPEAFERKMKAAWDVLMSDGIPARHTYTSPQPGEDAVSIGFRVRYSDLGLDYVTARELAF